MKASSLYLVAGLLILFFFSAVQQVPAENITYHQPSDRFSRAELARILAPVALYPDVLLSQVLMASTYPIEVIEAERWIRNNPGLGGTDLDVALFDQDWAPSVKALCHFPQVLELMSDRISQTADIGNAFLAREEEVLDVIQELREKAYTEGNLVTSPEQKIIITGETIIIEPADPRVVYVPYYDSVFIYGTWGYPDYPPYSWTPARVKIVRRISYWPRYYLGYSFGTWSVLDWQQQFIYIDVHKRPRYIRRDHWRKKHGRWSHDSRHRRGVSYHNTFNFDQFFEHSRRSGPGDHHRRDRSQKYNRRSTVPDRVMPWDDKGSKFQVPDRTMPWEENSVREYRSEQGERNKTIYKKDRHQRRTDENYYRFRQESDAMHRSRKGDEQLRQLWNIDDFSNTQKRNRPQRQSHDGPTSGAQQSNKGQDSRDGATIRKKSGGIKPGLRLR